MVISRLISDPDVVLGISTLTIYELSTRLRQSGIDAQTIQETVRTYAGTVDFVVPVTDEIAAKGAELRAIASNRIAAVDVLIAATAANAGAVLVHRDPHFASLPSGSPVQVVLPDKK